jgi:hypothetical protein
LQVPNNPSVTRPGNEGESSNLWDELEEPPIEVDEFDNLFSVPETQKKETKNSVAEPKSLKAKVTATSVLDAKRSQNVWIMVKNLKSHNLDIERLEYAIYHVDLTDLDYEKMVKIKEMMVSKIDIPNESKQLCDEISLKDHFFISAEINNIELYR